MRKKVLSAMLSGILCLSLGVGAYAADNSARIAEIEAEIASLQAELRELKIAAGETLVEGMELYSGEYGILTFKEVTADGIVFSLENTTDSEYTVYSEYMTIDGEQYNDGWDENEEFYTGGICDDIAPGGKKDVKFLVTLEDSNILEISGQLIVCDFPTGENLGLVAFSK